MKNLNILIYEIREFIHFCINITNLVICIVVILHIMEGSGDVEELLLRTVTHLPAILWACIPSILVAKTLIVGSIRVLMGLDIIPFIKNSTKQWLFYFVIALCFYKIFFEWVVFCNIFCWIEHYWIEHYFLSKKVKLLETELEGTKINTGDGDENAER